MSTDPDPLSRLDDLRLTRIWGSMLDEDEAKPETKVVTNDLGMRFVRLPDSPFEMGADPAADKRARANEGPKHIVVFPKPVFIGVTPVTQAQYLKVTGRNPSAFAGEQGGPDHPVEGVTWHDAAAFCQALGELPAERTAKRTYRLPTEAEWECGCRAGNTSSFTHGDELSSANANFGGAYGPDGDPRPPARGRTNPVTAYPANYFGLHDMHGNVWEWCQDWYAEDYYEKSPVQNPGGPPEGRFKVTRGGCWRSLPGTCRSAYRNAVGPNNRDQYTGFRVVLVMGG